MAQVKYEEQIGGGILRLKGKFIGGDETDELQDHLKKITQKEEAKLIVDMDKVTYLNSTALGILISAHTNFAKRKGKIVLANLSDTLENLFVITKLTLVFPIAENIEEAIKIISE